MVTSKSDKETVIEMGPVNNEKKFRLLTVSYTHLTLPTTPYV